MRSVFMGTPDFAVPSLQVLHQLTDLQAVYTQPDRPKGRGLAAAPPAVKLAALELGLPVRQPLRLRQPEVLAELTALRPDLIVVVAYAQLLPAALLELPRHGCVNVHASLLPAHRGGAPIHRAVLQGDAASGVTTMLMARGLDTGDILLQASTPIGPNETTGQLHDRLAPLGAQLLCETIRGLIAGQLTPRAQPSEGVSYAPNVQKSEGIIDWCRPAAEIHNQVRGLNPWPTAYTWQQGRLLRIWSTRLLAEEAGAAAGQVVELTGDGPIVATGAGRLLLCELQPESKRRMSGGDYVRGYGLQPGVVLGGESRPRD